MRASPAPDFTLEPSRPARVSCSSPSLRGKVVVLNFWASWCEPCKQEAPGARGGLAKNWAGRVVVLGVDVNDFSRRARRFMRTHGIDYPVVHDNGNVTSPEVRPDRLCPRRSSSTGAEASVRHVVGQVNAGDLRRGSSEALRA